VGPLVLIFIGGVFLLQNAGYLPPNVWMNLWRFWPLVLVLAGIELLLAHRVPWLALVGLAAVVLIVGAVASGASLSTSPAQAAVTRTSQTDLSGATQAAVTVRFGAGQLNIGPLVQSAENQLATMAYEGPPDLAPQASYSPDGGTGQLAYQVNGHWPGFTPFVGSRSDARMDLNLSPTVPITSLTVQTGATDAHLDLSSLRVGSLDVSVGAASTWIRLPEAATMTNAHISGGAATITLEIPPGVGAQIRHRGGLSTVNVDQTRFPSVGDGVYRSSDYGSAANNVDISFETGVTSIQVN
jgi:cell wall-active antibiotic response 4TMS protein YvqF